MAHFAEIDDNNVVIRVLVTSNEEPDEGYQWLIDTFGGRWVKTSYNAIKGKYREPSTNLIIDKPGFRKNYAGIGYIYDEQRDAFIPPKPVILGDWVIDEETCTWKNLIEIPSDFTEEVTE